MNVIQRYAPALLGLMLICTPAAAERVSLAGIDVKLDQLINPFDPNRHITLRIDSSQTTVCSRDRAFFRVNPDGTQGADEFVVPAGSTLILYDFSWQASPDPNVFTPGRTLRMGLSTSTPSGSGAQTVYHSPRVDVTTANQFGILGASESIRAGVAVGEGRIVCTGVFTSSQTGGAVHSVTEMILRGILMENP